VSWTPTRTPFNELILLNACSPVLAIRSTLEDLTDAVNIELTRNPVTSPLSPISPAYSPTYQAPSIIGSVAPRFVTRSPSPIDYESTGDQALAAEVEAALAYPRPGCLSPAATYTLRCPDPSTIPAPFVPEPVVPPGYVLKSRIDVISSGVDNDQTLVNNTPAPLSPRFPVPPIPAAAYHNLPLRPRSTPVPGENQDFTTLRPDPHGASLDPDGNLDDDEEENIEPTTNHPAFRIPPCLRYGNRALVHPHQYHVLTSHNDLRVTWRPAFELQVTDLIVNIPSLNDPILHPHLGNYVTPFRARVSHVIKVSPRDQELTRIYRLGPIIFCSNLSVHPANATFPHGRLTYSFRESILRKLSSLPPVFRPAYAGSLVILSVFDFLDGRLLYTYGYIAFDDLDTPFVDHLTTHTEDLLRNKPDLLHFALSPRIPVDPQRHLIYRPAEQVHIEPGF